MSGQELAKSYWPSRKSNVQKIKYAKQLLHIYTEMTIAADDTISLFTGHKISTPKEMSESMMSVGRDWPGLIADLIQVTNPIPGKNCTLSLLNPLTGSCRFPVYYDY